MGADIKSLRTRIRSVDSTMHLTKAMGLVASSKIRRATRDMTRTREYAAAMHLKRPNSMLAAAMFSGFQLPKIITASARKPKPATSPLEVQLAVVSE